MPYINRILHVTKPRLTEEELLERRNHSIDYPLVQTEGYYATRELAEQQYNNLTDANTRGENSAYNFKITYEIV